MADATEQTTNTNETAQPTQDAAFWQSEAKKAFQARDQIKDKLRDLEGRVMSDEDRALFQKLRTDAEKAEETRRRKEGEFDSLKNQLVEKHNAEKAELTTRFTSLSERFKQSVKLAQFGAASDWFGGDSAKTVLDVQLGMDVLGKYVTVEDQDDDPLGYRIVVKTPRGEPILGADGNPAPFPEAIGELIKALPNKDRILRGSGKTGSGSAGGSKTGTAPAPDLQQLTERARQGDKDALKALKDRRAANGSMVFGSALSR